MVPGGDRRNRSFDESSSHEGCGESMIAESRVLVHAVYLLACDISVTLGPACTDPTVWTPSKALDRRKGNDATVLDATVGDVLEHHR